MSGVLEVVLNLLEESYRNEIDFYLVKFLRFCFKNSFWLAIFLVVIIFDYFNNFDSHVLLFLLNIHQESLMFCHLWFFEPYSIIFFNIDSELKITVLIRD